MTILTKYELLQEWINDNANDILMFAVHCDTNEKAEDFISMLYSMGFRWENDDLAEKHFTEDGTVTTKWEIKNKQTCYSITPTKIILFSSLYFYSSQGKIIIEYDDLFGNAENPDRIIDIECLKDDFVDEVVKPPEVDNQIDDISQLNFLDFKECPNCHNNIQNDGSKFCMECGFEVPNNFFIEPKSLENDDKVTSEDIIEENNEEKPKEKVKEIIVTKNDDASIKDHPVSENDSTNNLPKTVSFVTKSTDQAEETKEKSGRGGHKLQVFLMGIIIVAFAGAMLFVNQAKINSDNDFNKFSEKWELVEETTAPTTNEDIVFPDADSTTTPIQNTVPTVPQSQGG